MHIGVLRLLISCVKVQVAPRNACIVRGYSPVLGKARKQVSDSQYCRYKSFVSIVADIVAQFAITHDG